MLSDDGYQLRCTIQGQEIDASDAYGMTLVEGIYRGQNWRVQIRGLEWNKTGLLASLQAFGMSGANTTLTPTLANIGERYSKYAQAMVLTAILGNPPSTPQTLTASSAIIAPQSVTDFNITSKMREMPIEYVLLPYTSATSGVGNVPFSTTG